MSCKVFITGAVGTSTQSSKMQTKLTSLGYSTFAPRRLASDSFATDRKVDREAILDRQWIGCCDALIELRQHDSLSQADCQFAYECSVPRFSSVNELAAYCKDAA